MCLSGLVLPAPCLTRSQAFSSMCSAPVLAIGMKTGGRGSQDARVGGGEGWERTQDVGREAWGLGPTGRPSRRAEPWGRSPGLAMTPRRACQPLNLHLPSMAPPGAGAGGGASNPVYFPTTMLDEPEVTHPSLADGRLKLRQVVHSSVIPFLKVPQCPHYARKAELKAMVSRGPPHPLHPEPWVPTAGRLSTFGTWLPGSRASSLCP